MGKTLYICDVELFLGGSIFSIVSIFFLFFVLFIFIFFVSIFFFTRINAMNIIVYIALFMPVIAFATARPEGSHQVGRQNDGAEQELDVLAVDEDRQLDEEMEESERELEMDDFAQKRMAAQPRQAMEYMRDWCCGNCNHYRARGYNMNSKCCHSPNAFDESKTDVFCCKDC